MSESARMTVLSSVSGMYATKRIRRHRKTGAVTKIPYGRETYFQVEQVGLSGFDHLCKVLDALKQRTFAFVIRGEPLPDANLVKTRRLVYPDADTGDPASFAAAARSWFAVDIDKARKPVAIDPISDPDGAIEHLIGLLPPELHDASCWWQYTSSQSLPGCEDTLSARLWFWLLAPLDDASLTRWASSANKAFGSRLIDPSLYRAVQPHYVADPIFEDGVSDPLPRRHGIRVGLDKAVSLLIPDASVEDPYVASGGYVGLGIEGHLAEIGGDRGFRAPMVSAIAAYFTANGADASPEPIMAKVREAIARADPGNRTDTDIARYCSDRHLNDIVGWVRARERANPRPKQPPPDLAAVANSVPVNGERAAAVRAIAGALIRCNSIPARLSLALTEAWNEQHCSPPLLRDQARAIVYALARRQVARVESRDGR